MKRKGKLLGHGVFKHSFIRRRFHFRITIIEILKAAAYLAYMGQIYARWRPIVLALTLIPLGV